jgi:hypothetical protein
MPPKKQKGKRTVAKSAPKIKPRISFSIGNRLDEQAKAYGRLLRDPCSAPLVHPTFTGGEGGMLVRAEYLITLFVNSTSTCGVVVWIPGGIGNVGASAASGVIGAESPASSGAITPTNYILATQPGYTYLSTAAADVRAVAACMQVFYPGTESTRSGILAYGNVSGAAIVSGTSTSVSNVSNILERYERVPTNSIELMWRPADFDQTPTAPTYPTTQADLNKRSGLCVALQGGALAVGLTVRFVCVYEYTPALGSGITTSSTSRNTSSSTLNSVLNVLDAAGDWMVRGGSLASKMYGMYNSIQAVPAIAYGGRTNAPFRLM